MSAIRREVTGLVRSERWAALATVDDGAPSVAMVAYAMAPDSSGLLFFLSELSAHTRHLLAGPVAALAITRADRGDGDPQTLPRVSLQGTAAVVGRDDERFQALAEAYVARFPDAAPRFRLGDFRLFLFTPSDVRYVGGFARAASFNWAELIESS